MAIINAAMREHVQQLLSPPSEEEMNGLREKLSGLFGEYVNIEDQKKAANEDYNERMADLWDEIRSLQARIQEAEEAAG